MQRRCARWVCYQKCYTSQWHHMTCVLMNASQWHHMTYVLMYACLPMAPYDLDLCVYYLIPSGTI